MPRKKSKYFVATLDFETDPFRYGRVPKPFAVEFYAPDTNAIFSYWGNDCANKLADFLEREADAKRFYIIYAHNGGKFDFHFINNYLSNPVRIINSRIVSAGIFGHILRDSFAIIPIPLKAYAKDDIDYDKMEIDVREKHQAEILAYLHTDCVRLYELVAAFIERFGLMMTVGSTAMQEIMARHQFERMPPESDVYYRQFYFGGRVQCFGAGVIRGPWKGYDVNSMYPYVMRNKLHPLNNNFSISRTMPDNFDKPFFLHFRGRNRGALPIRTKEGLDFNVSAGEFFACSHEIEVALRYGLIDIDEVIQCHVAQEHIRFLDFVDDFYKQKLDCKERGDKIGELFAKFMLNSGYGKFGQNPENFSDWLINRDFGNDVELRAKGFSQAMEYETFELWQKPAKIKDSAYYDVSIAASITSAARAVLLEGLQSCEQPIYCDTDSIICKAFDGFKSDTELGGWKREFECNSIAIAGKKLYMAYNDGSAWNHAGISKLSADKAINRNAVDKLKPENPIKLVSKGGTISPDGILALCEGKSIESPNQAPTFSVRRDTRFISKTFRMTVDTGYVLEYGFDAGNEDLDETST